jgi:hypothetical protein
LQGYMLTNGKGDRIDVGPIKVVGDREKTSGTNEVVNGVSCMACHAQGMRTFKDQVRTGTSVFGLARRKVERLYPETPEMDKLVKEDQDRFLSALQKAVGPFLPPGASDVKAVSEMTEPVAEIARLYTLGDLDVQTIALELGLEKSDTLLIKIGERRLQELGLGPLATGGRMARREWETGKGMSLFQRTARELGATPYSVGP